MWAYAAAALAALVIGGLIFANGFIEHDQGEKAILYRMERLVQTCPGVPILEISKNAWECPK